MKTGQRLAKNGQNPVKMRKKRMKIGAKRLAE